MRDPRFPHRTAAAALIAALAAPPGAARAQSATTGPQAEPNPGAQRAQDAAPTPADAQSLHDRARRVMEQGRPDAACRMLEKVQAALSGSTAAGLAVAECHLRADRLATALEQFTLLEAQASRNMEWSRVWQARARREAIDARVAHLVLRLPDTVKTLPGLEIRRDGLKIDPARMGEPIPVDVGRHRIEVTAAGKQPMASDVHVGADGVTYVVDVGTPNRLETPTPDSPPLSTPPGVWSSEREGSLVPGIVALSAGASALAVGSMTGILALDLASGVKSTCRDGLCPPSQQAQGRRAETLATVATAELVAGAVAAAAGVTLLVWRPFGRNSGAASVAAGLGSIQAVGRF